MVEILRWKNSLQDDKGIIQGKLFVFISFPVLLCRYGHWKSLYFFWSNNVLQVTFKYCMFRLLSNVPWTVVVIAVKPKDQPTTTITNQQLPSPTNNYHHQPITNTTNRQLPPPTNNYHHQPATTITNQQLPSPTNNYHHQPTTTVTNQQLPSPTNNYHHQPATTITNQQLPSPTNNYHHQPATTITN